MAGRRRCKPFTTKDTKVHEGKTSATWGTDERGGIARSSFVFLRALCGYWVGSEIQREIAVTILRGANRVDCATSQL